jgi:membrane-bound lytic murein transglycosylase F
MVFCGIFPVDSEEYEILKEFATEIGVDLEIVNITNLDDVNAMLNRGEGDLVACNYTVTNERSKIIDFTVPFLRTNQVLIQRKPENWETMSADQINSQLLTDPTQLAGKTVSVWGKSTYYQRLVNLQQEIGDTIIIHKETGDFTSEDLIENVSEGIIDYTVVEKNVAQINSHFLDNIDIDLELSVKQKIAFGIRKTSPLLRARINQWLKKFTQKASFKYLKHKYFELTEIANNVQDSQSSLKGGQLSIYDNYFKQSASKYNWDWRILASVS